MKKENKRNWLTVGVKILIGITFTTTACIGGLLYVFWQANEQTDSDVQELLAIYRQDGSHLRESIVTLQETMLSFTGFFKKTPENNLPDQLSSRFNLLSQKEYQGRASWKKMFSRSERRDLLKNKPILKTRENSFSVFTGIFDKDNNFTDSILQYTYSRDNSMDTSDLANLFNQLVAIPPRQDVIDQGILQLHSRIADEALKAEQTRTEMLDSVETIERKEEQLKQARTTNRKIIYTICALICLVNIIAIFILIRSLVERPLKKLTGTIKNMQDGNSPHVPLQNRTDQIGVLAGAIHNFKEALIEIKNEELRKQQEKSVINDTIQEMSQIIDKLEHKARNLNGMTEQLEILADAASSKARFVAKRAENTAELTETSADLAERLREAVLGIGSEINNQKTVISDLELHTEQSRLIIGELDTAAREIGSIVNMVHEISDQTKLLALNATIEAARAGAKGKGFSVVANEVKELSHETEKATVNIRTKISMIEAVCSRMASIAQKIDGRTIDLQSSSSSIETALHQQQEAVLLITGQLEKTAGETQNVSDHICQVQQDAARTKEIANHVRSETEHISSELTALLSGTTGRLQQVSELELAA